MSLDPSHTLALNIAALNIHVHVILYQFTSCIDFDFKKWVNNQIAQPLYIP